MLIETTMRYGTPRITIQEPVQDDELAEDDLIDACRDYEDAFADVAARKHERGEIDADGLVVITSVDI